MDRIRKLFLRRTSYEPLEDDAEPRDVDDELTNESPDEPVPEATRFSWVDFIIFLLLGNSMLWAWYISPSETSATSSSRIA
jgi:equilibrative nucleoside transporter 1/2/3